MHSKIFQITTDEIEREDFITSGSFEYEEFHHFGDYLEDVKEFEEEEIMQQLDSTLKGIFKREGRVLTYLGAEDFVNEWIIQLKDRVAELDNKNIKDWMYVWKLRHLFTDTHLESNYRFYCGNSYGTSAVPLGEFIRDVYANHKAGDILYIGGIVDFHI